MTEQKQERGNEYAFGHDLTPQLIPLATCKPLGREVRKHSPQQVRKLAASLNKFGFVLPIVVDVERRVIAGWGLVLAARQLELSEIPAVCISDLSDADKRMLRLTLNRIAESSSWNREALTLEFAEILELDPQIELEVSGFEMGEIDALLDDGGISQEDELPQIIDGSSPISQIGDVWILGAHRLLHGDALQAESYPRLLGSEKAAMMCGDPPYNVPVDGHVSGLGAPTHREFMMASGELSSAEFQAFLKTSLTHAVNWSNDGAIHYVFMDWRHQLEILAAGKDIYYELKNLCVWNKPKGLMGSLYRSKHELIFVFKVGKGPHINNVSLGKYGRTRTNVWDYVSQNELNGSSKSKLALHPTVKPVAMIADAIRDCSNRGGLILDPFGGAGTTIIAAERTGRCARVIEIDPQYVDIAVRRFEQFTGKPARLESSGLTFSEVLKLRRQQDVENVE